MTGAILGDEKRRLRWTVGAVVVCAAIIRFGMLGRFPAVEADEGLWTISAKNALLFGRWFMDGQTHLFLSPLYEGLLVPVFWLVGASIRSARLVSALAGTASVALLYILVRRTARDPSLALGAAALLATDELAVLLSREAVIESCQLAWILGTAILLASPKSAVRRFAAPVAFVAAIATKISSLFMAPILAGWLLGDWALTRSVKLSRVVADLLVFIGVASLLSAVVYGALYAWHPAQFVGAFRFELDGVHFQRLSNPIVRVGRFGVDPAQVARTVLALFRESPFLLVLAWLGVLLAVLNREKSLLLWLLWAGFGVLFFLGQMYQPVRYFYLCWPPLAVAAVYLLRRASAAAPTAGWPILVSAVVAFNLAYDISNFAVNRDTMLGPVRAWATMNTAPTDRLMSAAYLATDIPRRVYSHYKFAASPSQLMASIDSLQVHYVIADRYEWAPTLVAALESRFPVLKRWVFGAVYETAPVPCAHPPCQTLPTPHPRE